MGMGVETEFVQFRMGITKAFFEYDNEGAILIEFIKKSNMYSGASRTCPLYVFDSDMEANVNMRRCGMNCLERETVIIILRVLNAVNSFIVRFLRAGEFIRNKEVLKVRLVSPGS
jgi:hypothetical protein